MPSHSKTAGTIILEEAYALGKMLESSGWNGLLRDNITPSDIDLCFDNNGSIIFVDFSNNCDSWTQLNKQLRGQRRLYESAIKAGPHCAILCRHSVAPEMGRKIDTLRDVDSFQVMLWDFGLVFSPVYDGARWQAFVIMWVNNKDGPMKIRRHIIGASVGLFKPDTAPPTDGPA